MGGVMPPKLPQRKGWSVEHAARRDGQSKDSLAWLVRNFCPPPSPTLRTGAHSALSVHGLLERLCDALRRFQQGIVGEMGVARGGLGLGVAEDSLGAEGLCGTDARPRKGG